MARYYQLITCYNGPATPQYAVTIVQELKYSLAIHIAGRRWGLRPLRYRTEAEGSVSQKYISISTCPRATQQGRVKCRHHVTVPAVLTQEAIPEEGG